VLDTVGLRNLGVGEAAQPVRLDSDQLIAVLMVMSVHLYCRDTTWAVPGRVMPELQNLPIVSRALSREKEVFTVWSTHVRTISGLAEAVGCGTVELVETAMAYVPQTSARLATP
jgi:hypothetical protein